MKPPSPADGRPSRRGAKRPRVVVLLSAFPRATTAERVARDLLRARHIACATVIPGGRAVYRWGGREVREASALLLGKTTAARAAGAVRALRAAHPDSVPEILVLPVAAGHAAYLDWIGAEVT